MTRVRLPAPLDPIESYPFLLRLEKKMNPETMRELIIADLFKRARDQGDNEASQVLLEHFENARVNDAKIKSLAPVQPFPLQEPPQCK